MAARMILMLLACVAGGGCARTQVFVTGNEWDSHHVAITRLPWVGCVEHVDFDVKARTPQRGVILSADIPQLRHRVANYDRTLRGDQLRGFIDYYGGQRIAIQLLYQDETNPRQFLQSPINGTYRYEHGRPSQVPENAARKRADPQP
jgi:hypothetical protein